MTYHGVLYNQCTSNTWKFSIFIFPTRWIRVCKIRFISTGVICGNLYPVCETIIHLLREQPYPYAQCSNGILWWMNVVFIFIISFSIIILTHLCLAFHKRDIGKQCRPRSDATEHGVWSGFTLFALITGISIKHGNNKKNNQTLRTPSIGNGPVKRVEVETVTRHKWINTPKNFLYLLAITLNKQFCKQNYWYILIKNMCWGYSLEALRKGNICWRYSLQAPSSTNNICFCKEQKNYVQTTLVISTSLISNNRLSRSENLVPVLPQRSTNRQQNIVEKRRNCSLGAISPLFHNTFIYL